MDQRALVLVSLNPQAVESVVTLPASPAGPWTDAVSGESFAAGASLKIGMSPYQVRVLARQPPS